MKYHAIIMIRKKRLVNEHNISFLWILKSMQEREREIRCTYTYIAFVIKTPSTGDV